MFPELFKGRECHVAVETQGELTMGACVVDWWGTTGKTPNALWINEVDADKLFEQIAESIAVLP